MAAAISDPFAPDELLRRAHLRVAAADWTSAIAFCEQVLRADAPEPSAYFAALQMACWAQHNAGGVSAVRRTYDPCAGALLDLLPVENANPAWLRAAFDSAILAEDLPTVHALFHKVHRPDWQGVDLAVSPATSLAAWSRASGTPLTTIEPAHVESNAAFPAARGHWNYATEAVVSMMVSGAEVLLGWDFVALPSGAILGDSGYCSLTMVHSTIPHYFGVDFVVHPWQPAAVDVDADVLIMTAPPDQFVGHWMIDFLPRLRALDPHGDLKIVVPAGLPQKLLDLLLPFGIGPDRILFCAPAERYRFRRALVVHTGDPHRPSAETVRFVGRALRLPAPADAPRTRLLLLRDTPTRSIANRAEVDGTLAKYGFEAVALASLSIAEQRERIGRAEVVIATYGSDLLANWFMPPGSHLVEMNYDPDKLDAAAAARCAFLDIHHHLLRCARTAQAGAMKLKKDSDFHVDCIALDLILRDIFRQYANA